MPTTQTLRVCWCCSQICQSKSEWVREGNLEREHIRPQRALVTGAERRKKKKLQLQISQLKKKKAKNASVNTRWKRVARKQSGPFHRGPKWVSGPEAATIWNSGQRLWHRQQRWTLVGGSDDGDGDDSCRSGRNIFVWAGDDDSGGGGADVDQPLFTSSIGTFSSNTDLLTGWLALLGTVAKTKM